MKLRKDTDVAPSVRALVKNVVFDRVPGLLRRGPATAKRVAITFDDGPDHLSERYLETLDRLGIPATFFLIGALAEARPDLVREYLRRGHQIAGHGYDHMRFSTLGRRALLDQCSRTDRVLKGNIGGRPWVRPPHGDLDAASIITLLAGGYAIALWSFDSEDYGDKDPVSIANRCAPQHMAAGEVLLFHEGQHWTLDALPQVVGSLRAAGYECVTMRDLFAR